MRNRPLNDEDALYERQLNLLGFFPYDCIDFDGRFKQLTSDQQDLLNRYFFADREIDVDDVFDYRESLLKENPSIQEKATKALKELLAKFTEFDEDLSKDNKLFDTSYRADWQK